MRGRGGGMGTFGSSQRVVGGGGGDKDPAVSYCTIGNIFPLTMYFYHC